MGYESGDAGSAGRSLVSRIVRSPWKAGVIVLLLVIALAGSVAAITRSVVAGGYLQRIDALQAAVDDLKQEVARKDSAWLKEYREMRNRAVAAETRYRIAREKVEKVRAEAEKAWTPPVGPLDTVRRFRSLGVRGEVLR